VRQFRGLPKEKVCALATASHSRQCWASNPDVRARRTFGVIAAAYLLALGCLVVFAPTNLQATPVEPDIQKLAEEAQQPRPFFIPSRVGWNGSEMARDGRASGNVEASMAPILAAQRERQVRATLWEIVVPEPSAILGLAGIIFLLRKLRSLREQQPAPQRQPQLA
jgi:hypothetical protein